MTSTDAFMDPKVPSVQPSQFTALQSECAQPFQTCTSLPNPVFKTGAYSSTESNCKAMLCNSAQFVQKVIQHCHRWSAHLRYFHHAIGRLMGDPLLTMAYGPLFFRNLVSVGAMGLYSKNIRQRPQRTAAVDAILAIS